jgi:hypothetical protein
MNKLKSLASVLAAAVLVGCSTVSPLVTPAALTAEVSVGIQVGLNVYPAAAPDVAIARDIICTAAQSTNVSPANIIADLEAAGITNSNSKLIVNAAVLVYSGAYDLIGTNTTGVIQPYAQALCQGFTQGLPPSTPAAAVRASRQILPPHLR